jgi:curli production assembly/transport component CsgG
MNFDYKIIVLFAIGNVLMGCGAYFNQPIMQQQARTGELTTKSQILKDLPLPAEPVVVGVYNFKDQTGQYKNIESGSSFSTAVSQGATTILIKALEDSKWFTPIERENLGNLLNERNIIRATRDEYRKSTNPNEPNLPPLLFAGVLLEGGVISYDSNIITGGAGARYFGVGGATQYREDRITVYLRAVSTSSGKILKTVYVSKTILSQAVSANLFKFVNFKRLLEVETGFTRNEPVQLAMKDAIEKAVESLIIEGIQDKLWTSKEGQEVNDKLVEAYLLDKEMEESTKLYDRKLVKRDFKNSFSAAGGANILDGDLADKKMGFLVRAGYSRELTRSFFLDLNANAFQFVSGKNYTNRLISLDLNASVYLLPDDNFGPYLYAGFGVINDLVKPEEKLKTGDTYFKIQYGVGVEYFVSERIGIFAFGEHNLAFSDELDRAISGKRNDFHYNFGLGIKYYFGKKRNNDVFEKIEE